MTLFSLLGQKLCSSQASSVWRMLVIAAFSVVFFVEPVDAQEPPNPLYAIEPFDTSVSFRSDVCELQEMIHNKTLKLDEALQGLELRFVLIPSQYFQLDEETGGLNEDYPGLIPDLLDQLAERAGFTWRNSYAVTTSSPVELNRTWWDLLEWSTNTYDVSGDWWALSLERLTNGIRFPESWYDGSIIMVGDTSEEETSQFSMLSWLKPFDYQVWILIGLSIMLSGAIYWILEGIDNNSDKRRLEKNIFENMFLAGLTFTSHFEFKPRTNAARLFTFSLSLWALILGASYTANLASFLVVKNTPKIAVNTVADAVRLQLPMCVEGTTQADTYVSTMFPTAKLIRKDNAKDVFLGVQSGECHVAITTVSTWDYFENDKEVNPGCSLGWIGRTLKFVPAGFATKGDSGTLCTSVITDALNVHLLQMKENGSIDNAWKKFLSRTATINCEDLGEAADTKSEEESGQLTIKNVGGIFVIHYIMSFLAVFIAIIYRWTGWDQIPQFDKFGPNSREAVRKMLRSLGSMGHGQSKIDPRQAMMMKAAQHSTVKDVLKKMRRRSQLGNEADGSVSNVNNGDFASNLSDASFEAAGASKLQVGGRSRKSFTLSNVNENAPRADIEVAGSSAANLQASLRANHTSSLPIAFEEINFNSDHSTDSEPSLDIFGMSGRDTTAAVTTRRLQDVHAQTASNVEYLAQRQTIMENKQNEMYENVAEMYENVAKILSYLQDNHDKKL